MARIPVYEAQQGLETDRGGMVRYQPLDAAAGALGQLGNTIESVSASVQAKQKAAADKAETERKQFDDFKTRISFAQLQNDIDADKTKMETDMPETGEGFATGFKNHIKTKLDQFLTTVPPELQEEYKVRLDVAGQQYGNIADEVETKAKQKYAGVSLNRRADELGNNIAAKPENWRAGVTALNDMIDLSPLPQAEKDKLKRDTEKLMFNAALAGYKEQGRFDDARKAVDDRFGVKPVEQGSAPKASNLADGIVASAKALGIRAVDLATAISYETAGTFNPSKRGPVTKWGQHKGLIQWGEPQASKYGVDWKDPIGSQLGANGAIVKYLRDAGVKAGMGLMEVYSAINAGRVGRNNASDAKNGGAPGSVADKVNFQMDGHKAKAASLLEGKAPVEVTNGTFSERDAIMADIDQDQKRFDTMGKAQADADYKGRLNALLVDVSEGRSGESDILEARNSWLSDFEDIKKVKTAREQYVKDQEEQTSIADRLTSGGFINPSDEKDRAALDKYSLGYGSAEDVMGGKPATVNAMYGVYDQTGMVGKTTKAAIHAMLATTDTAKITTALSYLAEFERRNPQAFKREFTENDEKALLDYKANADYKSPEEIAKTFTETRDTTTDEVRKVRVKEAEKQVKDLELGDVTNLFDPSYLPFNEPGMIDQGASDALLSDYKAMVVDEYSRTGDMDLSKTNAAQRITRVWGASVASGGRIMKFPPERYLPQVNGSFDYMKSQIEADLVAKGYARESLVRTSVRDPGRKTKTPFQHYLVADDKTRAAVSGGAEPSYQVWVQDENGLFDVVTDKAGGILRYKFDAKGAADAARAENEKKQKANAVSHGKLRKAMEDTFTDSYDPMGLMPMQMGQ